MTTTLQTNPQCVILMAERLVYYLKLEKVSEALLTAITHYRSEESQVLRHFTTTFIKVY